MTDVADDPEAGPGTGAAAGAVAASRNLIDELALLNPKKRKWVIGKLSEGQKYELALRWKLHAHRGQCEPEGDWRVWLIRAGRGFGKTRAGAEWVSAYARDHPKARIALVGDTVDDVATVMVEGTSGLIAVAHKETDVKWLRDRGEVHFASGAQAQVFSANAPEKLRGPEHDAAWCDELGKWRDGGRAWDNLMLGMRRGPRPKVVVTTTPRPNALMRRVRRMPETVETLGSTRDNPHLATSFVADMDALYAGTRLGRQEIEGELIDDIAGALWTRDGIEACRTDKACDAVRIVVAVDPPAGTANGKGGDACGIVAAAIDGDGIVHVLEDASVEDAAPEAWARAVAACAARHAADRVVAEANQGGAMVESVLRAADAGLPVTLVRATRGKSARAEPVSMLYATRKVRHSGRFERLEDELCGLIAGGGYEGPGRSPDRADALVWAVTELAIKPKRAAAVRRL